MDLDWDRFLREGQAARGAVPLGGAAGRGLGRPRPRFRAGRPGGVALRGPAGAVALVVICGAGRLATCGIAAKELVSWAFVTGSATALVSWNSCEIRHLTVAFAHGELVECS